MVKIVGTRAEGQVALTSRWDWALGKRTRRGEVSYGGDETGEETWN